MSITETDSYALFATWEKAKRPKVINTVYCLFHNQRHINNGSSGYVKGHNHLSRMRTIFWKICSAEIQVHLFVLGCYVKVQHFVVKTSA